MTGADLLLAWVATAVAARHPVVAADLLAEVPLWAWAALACFAFWGFGMLSLAGLI